MKATTLLFLLPLGLSAQPGPQLPDAFHPDNSILGMPMVKHQYAIRPDKELVKGVGFLPGRMHKVHGLTISASTERKSGQPLQISGMNLDLQPLGIFIVPYVVFFIPPAIIGAHRNDEADSAHAVFAPTDTLVEIRGFDLRLMGSFPSATLKGMGLTAGVSTYPVQKGIAISVFGNVSEELHGAQVALVANTATVGKGIQIGLFNYTEGCDCLQLGLLNRNGKSLQPIVNWKRKRTP